MTSTTLPPQQHNDVEAIAVIGFVHGVSHFFHLLLPPLFPWLMNDFGLSFTGIGATMTVFFVISGIGQALSGFWSIDWARRGCWAAASVAFSLPQCCSHSPMATPG